MAEKKCFKCQKVKPLEDFYKHPMMADGRLGKCKECNRKDVRENRGKKIAYYQAYDRDRGNRQPKGYLREYRERFPKKYLATSMIARALRSKKLFKEPCEMCGIKKSVHAHHDDYAKPLNVRWLCAAHHRQWHVANGEAKNPF